jgi:hypothetical protein
MSINIITNGLLLTPDVVDRLTPFGLKGVKITPMGTATPTPKGCAAARAPSIGSSRTSDGWRAGHRSPSAGISTRLDRQLPGAAGISQEQEFADKLVKVESG